MPPKAAEPFSNLWSERFWSKVDTSAGPEACWPWMGARTHRRDYGYLVSPVSGRRVQFMAHRVAYQLGTGDDPGLLQVCHRCDFGLCCNPAHLWKGTQVENIADMDAKGRRRALRGEQHPRATLTSDQVAEIRVLLGDVTMSNAMIAERYGVSPTSIRRIGQGDAAGDQTRFGGAPIDRRRAKALGARHHGTNWTANIDTDHVKELYALKWTQEKIAREFHVSQGVISSILAGTHWSQRRPNP